MGHGFGELARITGIVYYRLSPFEQRAFAGMISKGITNTLRRFREEVVYIAPPGLLAYSVYQWAESTHEKLMRKNPADYADEK